MTHAFRSSARFLSFLLWVLGPGIGLSQVPASVQEVRVNSPAALATVLAEIQGGTILLGAGDYGLLELQQAYPEGLILRSETLHGARFEAIRLTGASGVTLQGVRLAKGISITKGASDVAVQDSRIFGTVYLLDVANFTLANNEVTGGHHGIVLNAVAGFRITHNYVHNVTEDLVRITRNSFNGLIENNIITNTNAKYPMHPDIFQFIHHKGITPHDITIRGNILHDAPEPGNTRAQGIFISDPGRGEQNKGYKDILIEDNLINVAAVNTIYVHSGDSSVQILNNTLISRDGAGGVIRLVGKDFGQGGPVIDGNVFKALGNESRNATLGDNFIYGTKTPESTLFSGTNGADWKSYQPILGSTLDRSGMGAVRFLADLQAAQKPGYDKQPLLGPSWAQ